MKEKAKTETQRLVYAGRREMRGGKVGYYYYKVVGGDLVDNESAHIFTRPLARGLGVGVEIDVEVKPGADVLTVVGDATYVGRGELAREEWRTLDAAAADAKKLAARKRDDKRDASLAAVLEPVRRAYLQSTPTARAAILGRIVYEITRGVR